jgi:hypothetical protein
MKGAGILVFFLVLLAGIAQVEPSGSAAGNVGGAGVEAGYDAAGITEASAGTTAAEDILCGSDIYRDGVINYKDVAVMGANWLSEDCSSRTGSCDGADLNEDMEVNFEDVAIVADCWLALDTVGPTPDPMGWDPNVEDSGIDGRPRQVWLGPDETWDWGAIMSADPNTFDEIGVEFYFECTNRPGEWPEGLDSGWIEFPDGPPYTHTVNVGQKNQIFFFRVRARDRSFLGNTTGWSSEELMQF